MTLQPNGVKVTCYLNFVIMFLTKRHTFRSAIGDFKEINNLKQCSLSTILKFTSFKYLSLKSEKYGHVSR